MKKQLYQTIKKELKGRKLNIVAGGFPCQGFSMAGNRDIADTRNQLYKEMVKVVKHLQPDIVIGENVQGILSMNKEL